MLIPQQIAKEFEIETELFMAKSRFRDFVGISVKYIPPVLHFLRM